jgi:hypothetical protein
LTFNRGDLASISFAVVISASTVQMNSFVEVRDTGISGGAIVDLPANFFDPSITIARQIARVVRTAGRQAAKTLVARTVVEYNYAQIAANVTPSFTFDTRQTFLLNGAEVDYVNAQTVPSLSTYGSWVSAGTFILAEDETWSRWLGNIYEKKRVQVVAV